MKIVLFLIIALGCIKADAQVLKELGRGIKSDAHHRIRQKVDQKVSKTIDSILEKKTKDEKKEKRDTSTKGQSNPGQPKNNPTLSATTNKKDPAAKEELTVSEGYVQLHLSASEVFRGGTVVIKGYSVKWGSLKEVTLTITGPGTNEKEKLALFENNSFAKAFQAEVSGEFTITVASSDGKSKETAKLKVLDIELLDDWTESNIEETDKAFNKLKKEVARVEGSIGEKDKAKLRERLHDVAGKVQTAKKLFTDLNAAMKGLGELSQKGLAPSPTLASHLSKLNDLLAEQRNTMQQMAQVANHEPYDNTVCEYLVMVNEACAAFSTFSNVWSKSVWTILKNVALDKVVPKGVETANSAVGKLPEDYDVLAKQPAKLFSAALFDAESLFSKMGAAGFTGDLVQFTTDFLLKSYCGVFKGTVKHDYEITYRNNQGVIWWKYSYGTEASVTFRYPKNSSGSIIKMKGNIEGNATRFTIYQDVEQMDDFKQAMKGRAKLTPVKLYQPPSLPFATSQHDGLGFGAVARGLATPAYFNIPVDAEFNTDDNTVKIYVNDALVDFTPMVKFTYGYIAVAAGIPLVTRVDFPVNKAKLTLNAVVSKNNELQVERDGKNNLLIRGKGSRQVGSISEPIEHRISYSLVAKKD